LSVDPVLVGARYEQTFRSFTDRRIRRVCALMTFDFRLGTLRTLSALARQRSPADMVSDETGAIRGVGSTRMFIFWPAPPKRSFVAENSDVHTTRWWIAKTVRCWVVFVFAGRQSGPVGAAVDGGPAPLNRLPGRLRNSTSSRQPIFFAARSFAYGKLSV